MTDATPTPERSTAIAERMDDDAQRRGGLSLLPREEEWGALARFVDNVYNSGLVPDALRGKKADVLLVCLAGHELGLSPVTSLSQIHVVDGRPGLSAQLMVGLVREAGHSFEIVESTDEACTVKGVRADNGDEAEASFTIEQARKVPKLLDKWNWKAYPSDLLFARAASRLCRRLFPDVLLGLAYTPEELGADVAIDGTPRGGEAVVVPDDRAVDHDAPARMAAQSVEPVEAVEPDEIIDPDPEPEVEPEASEASAPGPDPVQASEPGPGSDACGAADPGTGAHCERQAGHDGNHSGNGVGWPNEQASEPAEPTEPSPIADLIGEAQRRSDEAGATDEASAEKEAEKAAEEQQLVSMAAAVAAASTALLETSNVSMLRKLAHRLGIEQKGLKKDELVAAIAAERDKAAEYVNANGPTVESERPMLDVLDKLIEIYGTEGDDAQRAMWNEPKLVEAARRGFKRDEIEGLTDLTDGELLQIVRASDTVTRSRAAAMVGVPASEVGLEEPV